MDIDSRRLDFVGVVLAAGLSTRMGRNKLLMEIAGRPMIRHVVETVRSAVVDVVVVVGHHADRITEALERLPVRCVPVKEQTEQGDSIRTGLAAVPAERGALVCVGDQPRLTEREIAGLFDAFRAVPGGRVLVPVYEGSRGYPMVVPAGFDHAGLDLSADDLLDRAPDRVRSYPTRNPVYVSGVDSADDYRALFGLS